MREWPELAGEIESWLFWHGGGERGSGRFYGWCANTEMPGIGADLPSARGKISGKGKEGNLLINEGLGAVNKEKAWVTVVRGAQPENSSMFFGVGPFPKKMTCGQCHGCQPNSL